MSQRAPWNEPDPELLDCRQHFCFRVSRPHRIFALDRSDGLDRVRATDRLCSSLGKAEVLDLTLVNQVLHRSRHVFDRHVRVNTMLIVQVDDIGFESLERALRGLL